MESSQRELPIQSAIVTDQLPDLLVISVVAKPHHEFASYELLQAISAAGMRFGEMNIFHYYLPTLMRHCEEGEACSDEAIQKTSQITVFRDNENMQQRQNTTLFSLASLTKPGYFHLDKMGDFSCAGLTLFMDIHAVPDPSIALDLMVSTAEQLADDLDGELRAGQKMPWNEEVLKEYRLRCQLKR